MNTFTLTETQSKQLTTWLDLHDKSCIYWDDGIPGLTKWPPNENEYSLAAAEAKTISGRLTYEFTPNDIGEVQIVRCACGDKVDLTDYKEW